MLDNAGLEKAVAGRVLRCRNFQPDGCCNRQADQDSKRHKYPRTAKCCDMAQAFVAAVDDLHLMPPVSGSTALKLPVEYGPIGAQTWRSGPISGAKQIVRHPKDQQRQHDSKPQSHSHIQHPIRQGAPRGPFVGVKHQMATIKHGNRQKVHETDGRG